MAGLILGKNVSVIALASANGSSLTNLSGAAATTANLDVRTSGNAAGLLRARFQLTVQWATITGITLNKLVAELYLVPLLDGSNAPQIDTTAGSSAFPGQTFFGQFVATKAPTANTDTIFVTSEWGPLPQELLTAYIRNTSGQTMTSNWSLAAYCSEGQYT